MFDKGGWPFGGAHAAEKKGVEMYREMNILLCVVNYVRLKILRKKG